MHRKHSLFITTLLVAFSLSPSSFAQNAPDVYFYPKSGWTVSSISDENAFEPICRISSEFNNGYILEVTGTKSAINNMTVNFRQSIFELNQTYKARLSVPGQTNKDVFAKAFQDDVLNIDFKSHRDLFIAMRNGGVFDLNVEGNDFRFYLTGFAGAQDDFNRCVTAEAVQTQVEISKPAIEIAPTSPQPIIQAAEDIATPVARAPSATIPRSPDVSPRVDLSMGSVQSSLRPNARKPVETAEPENAAFTTKRPQPFVPAPKAVTPAPIVKAQPLPDVETTQAVVAKPIASPEEVYSKEVNKIKEMEPIISVAQEKPKPRPVSSSVPDKKNEFLKESMRELRQKITNLQQENVQLKSELEFALEEQEQEHISIASGNWNLERATLRFQEAERQMKRLGDQIRKQRARCTQEKQELEALLFDPELTESSQLAQLADLENQLLDAEEKISTQRARYEERIQILEGQLATQ